MFEIAEEQRNSGMGRLRVKGIGGHGNAILGGTCHLAGSLGREY